MKPELRKALVAELDRLRARVEAIELLLETSTTTLRVPSGKRDKVQKTKEADGRALRWQKASPEQRKAWADAIRAGRKRRRRRGSSP